MRTLHGLFPHDRSEERTPCDALRLFEALVECRGRGASRTANLSGDSEDGVKGPRRALLQALIGVVLRVEERDEQMASGEKADKTIVLV